MFRCLTYPFDFIPDQAKGRTFALPYPFKPLPLTPTPPHHPPPRLLASDAKFGWRVRPEILIRGSWHKT